MSVHISTRKALPRRAVLKAGRDRAWSANA
jgi:hypothetical protein